MQNDDASFWADIKNYEERLAKAPDSLLFARLAEVYLKVGLVDDALHTARRGTELHPGYIAGQRVLAMACDSKGLQDECREALIKVVTALPEDGEAQKMLGRLLAAQGDMVAAIRAFRTVLDFNPDDSDCSVELEALERSALPDTGSDGVESRFGTGLTVDGMDAEFRSFEDEEAEEILEDVEILDIDEADLLELEEAEETVEASEPVEPVSAQIDPLSTTTLAELYLQQGFTEKALEIYKTLLANDPDNGALRSRVAELDGTAVVLTGSVDNLPAGGAAHEEAFQEQPSEMSSDSTADAAGNSVAILEGWLDNIGRIKECR